MTRETIKEYILQIKSQDGTEALYNRWEPDILVEVINQIFDEHEAQLKLASDVYSTDKMHMYQELKAKDEEIERLKGKTQILEVLVDNTKYIIEAQTRMCRTKSRSIVAMLFWGWKKHKRMYGLSKFGSYLAVTHLNNATLTKLIFQKAYKMLKATKWH